MNRPSTYLACAALAHLLGIATSAQAQATDGQLMIGGGIAPVSVTYTKTKVEGVPEQQSTFLQSGLGGHAQLAAGFGLGPWVLAIETAFLYSVAHETEDVDDYELGYASEETVVTKRTDFMIGPSARFLFLEGAVRPFVEAGVGIGFGAVDGPAPYSEGTMLYVRGGPGVQLRLADSVSIDLMLRVGYSTTSGEFDIQIPRTGQSEGNPDAMGGTPDFGVEASGLGYNIRQISAELTARLSIWL